MELTRVAETVTCIECCKCYILPETAICGHTLCHGCWIGRQTCPVCALPLNRQTLKSNTIIKRYTECVQKATALFEKQYNIKMEEFAPDPPPAQAMKKIVEKDTSKTVNAWLCDSQNHFSAPISTQLPMQTESPVVEVKTCEVQVHTGSKKVASPTKVIHAPPPPQDDWDKIESIPDTEEFVKNKENVGPSIEPFILDDDEYTTDHPRRSSSKREHKYESKPSETSGDKHSSSNMSMDTDKLSNHKQNWSNVKKMRKEFSKLHKKNKNKSNVSKEICKKTKSANIQVTINIGSTLTNICIKKKKNDVKVKLNTDQEAQTMQCMEKTTSCHVSPAATKSNDIQNIEINIGGEGVVSAVTQQTKCTEPSVDHSKLNLNKTVSTKKNTASAETVTVDISPSLAKELSKIMESNDDKNYDVLKYKTQNIAEKKHEEVNQVSSTYTASNKEEKAEDIELDEDMFASGSVQENVQLLKTSKPAPFEIVMPTLNNIRKQTLTQRQADKRNRENDEEVTTNKKAKVSEIYEDSIDDVPKEDNKDESRINYDSVMGQVFASIDSNVDKSQSIIKINEDKTLVDKQDTTVVTQHSQFLKTQKTRKKVLSLRKTQKINSNLPPKDSESLFALSNVNKTVSTKKNTASAETLTVDISPSLAKELSKMMESNDDKNDDILKDKTQNIAEKKHEDVNQVSSTYTASNTEQKAEDIELDEDMFASGSVQENVHLLKTSKPAPFEIVMPTLNNIRKQTLTQRQADKRNRENDEEVGQVFASIDSNVDKSQSTIKIDEDKTVVDKQDTTVVTQHSQFLKTQKTRKKVLSLRRTQNINSNLPPKDSESLFAISNVDSQVVTQKGHNQKHGPETQALIETLLTPGMCQDLAASEHLELRSHGQGLARAASQDQGLARAASQDQGLARAASQNQDQDQGLARAASQNHGQDQGLARAASQDQDQGLARAASQNQGQDQGLARAASQDQDQGLARAASQNQGQDQGLAQAASQNHGQDQGLARAASQDQDQGLARAASQNQGQDQGLARAASQNQGQDQGLARAASQDQDQGLARAASQEEIPATPQDRDDSDMSVIEDTPQKTSPFTKKSSASNAAAQSKPTLTQSQLNAAESQLIKEIIEIDDTIVAKPMKFCNSVQHHSTPLARKSLNFSGELSSSTEDTKPRAPTGPKYCLAASCLTAAEVKTVETLCVKRNWKFVKEFSNELTHLVVYADEEGKSQRTVKYMCALAAGRWIVRYEWAEACLRRGNALEARFEALDFTGCPGPRRARTATRKLFEGFTFFCMPPFSVLSEPVLKAMLEAAGGRVVTTARDVRVIGDDVRLLLAEPEHTKENQFTYLAVELDIVSVNYEWALNCLGGYALDSILDLMLCQRSLLPTAAARWPAVILA